MKHRPPRSLLLSAIPRRLHPLLPLLPLLLLLMRGGPVDVVGAANQQGRSINIINESGRRVEIHWINPDDGSFVLQSTPDILNGASMSLNSFVGHRFQVRELPAKKTGVCAGEDQTCRIDHFTVNSNNDQSEFPSLARGESRLRFVPRLPW